MLSMSGGGLGLATDDDGATTRVAVRKGGSSVAWWTGAGRNWLVYGHMGGGDLLTALADWTSATPALTMPNLVGTSDAHLHHPGSPGWGAVRALAGVPGADTVFVGMGAGGSLGMGGGSGVAAGSVTRVGLGLDGGGAPQVTDNVPLAAAQVDGAVDDLAYCPATGSADAVADVLFVAVDSGDTGAVVRVTGASGDEPAATVVAATAHPAREVEVDCAAGTVWVGTAGMGFDVTGVGLLRSTDGGLGFGAAPTAGLPASVQVSALAINPTTPTELLLAAGSEGYLARTVDGGASWTAVNDPRAGGRSFASEGVNVLTFPPAAGSGAGLAAAGLPAAGLTAAGLPAAGLTAAGAAAAAGGPTLVGTGGGLFTATVGRTVPGLFFATNRRGTWAVATRVPATGADAATPALAVDPAGGATLVHRGATGLYATTRTAAGAWSSPAGLAGTTAADRLPVLRRGPGGVRHLAFVRVSGTPGVYYARADAAGVWGAPVRLTATAGDTTPALAVDAVGKVHIVYRRTSATAGLYHLTNRTGRWVRVKVTGTGAGDGAPSLACAPGSTGVRLAFARGKRGIYTTVKSATGAWVSPARRSTTGTDTAPALAVGGTASYVVFRRPGSGLYLVTDRGGRWSGPARVTGTGAADTGNVLVADSTTLRLAFGRSGGGVYVTSRTFAGRWATPARRSGSPLDVAPALAVDGTHHDYVVVDRG
jgi:hypothetical protein